MERDTTSQRDDTVPPNSRRRTFACLQNNKVALFARKQRPVSSIRWHLLIHCANVRAKTTLAHFTSCVVVDLRGLVVNGAQKASRDIAHQWMQTTATRFISTTDTKISPCVCVCPLMLLCLMRILLKKCIPTFLQIPLLNAARNERLASGYRTFEPTLSSRREENKSKPP